MALAIYFPVKNMSSEQFAKVHEKLNEAGAGEPDGRTYHCGFDVDDRVEVFDVWESQEKFDAFGAVLMPILEAEGIDPGEPMISEVVLEKS
jgi:hypothetical protein